MTVFSTSQGGDGYPDVFVYEGSNLVASGDAGVWVGPEATTPCLDVVRTPSDACGLAP